MTSAETSTQLLKVVECLPFRETINKRESNPNNMVYFFFKYYYECNL